MQSREAIEAGTALLGNLLDDGGELDLAKGYNIDAIAFAQAKFLESIALSLAALTELAQKPPFVFEPPSLPWYQRPCLPGESIALCGGATDLPS